MSVSQIRNVETSNVGPTLIIVIAFIMNATVVMVIFAMEEKAKMVKFISIIECHQHGHHQLRHGHRLLQLHIQIHQGPPHTRIHQDMLHIRTHQDLSQLIVLGIRQRCILILHMLPNRHIVTLDVLVTMDISGGMVNA